MKRRKLDLGAVPGNVARGADERLQASTPLRGLLNKVFPDHWSFLLGEIALFSFVVLLLTGVFLTLFFDRRCARSSTTAPTRACAGS